MTSSSSSLTIALLFPQLLGTYGDSGNALILANRARARGIDASVLRVDEAKDVPEHADLYVLGGGEDGAQGLAGDILRTSVPFKRALERDVPALAVCASFQLLGHSYAGAGGEPIEGMGVLDCVTRRGRRRLVGDRVVHPAIPELTRPLVGFENHGGVTTLGPTARPLGLVPDGRAAVGRPTTEGAVQGRLVATYLHGPVLSANPELADLLLTWAAGPLPELGAETKAADRWVESLRSDRLAVAKPSGLSRRLGDWALARSE